MHAVESLLLEPNFWHLNYYWKVGSINCQILIKVLQNWPNQDVKR